MPPSTAASTTIPQSPWENSRSGETGQSAKAEAFAGPRAWRPCSPCGLFGQPRPCRSWRRRAITQHRMRLRPIWALCRQRSCAVMPPRIPRGRCTVGCRPEHVNTISSLPSSRDPGKARRGCRGLRRLSPVWDMSAKRGSRSTKCLSRASSLMAALSRCQAATAMRSRSRSADARRRHQSKSISPTTLAPNNGRVRLDYRLSTARGLPGRMRPPR